MKYTAFIVDIVNSKIMPAENRKDAQLFIKRCLELLNIIFRPSLEFDVIFSAGDEVQGLFKNPASAFMYYRLLKMILSPLQLRCGLGFGELNVKMSGGTSAEQDGPAYHNAREAVLAAHKISGPAVIFHSESENDIYVNTLLNCSNLLMQKQSVYQNQIQLLIERLFPLFDPVSMDFSELQQICQLGLNKKQFQYFSSDKNHLFQNIDQFTFDCEPVDVFSDIIFKNKMVLESTIKKGLSARIANITGTSRQNIDHIIKSADIAAIRNIDLTAILYFGRNFKR